MCPSQTPAAWGSPKAPEPSTTAASAFHHPVTDTPSPCDTHTSTPGIPRCTPMPPPHPQQPPAQPSPAARQPRALWPPPVHRQPWHLITHAEPPLPPPQHVQPPRTCSPAQDTLSPLSEHTTTHHPSGPLCSSLASSSRASTPTLTQTHSGGGPGPLLTHAWTLCTPLTCCQPHICNT